MGHESDDHRLTYTSRAPDKTHKKYIFFHWAQMAGKRIFAKSAMQRVGVNRAHISDQEQILGESKMQTFDQRPLLVQKKKFSFRYN